MIDLLDCIDVVWLCLSGGFILLAAPTAVDLIGVENIHKAHGLTILFNGLASMSAAPFAGKIYIYLCPYG